MDPALGARPQSRSGKRRGFQRTDVGRCLSERLGGPEASCPTHHPLKTSEFLSFYDLPGQASLHPLGPLLWQRSLPLQTVAIKSGQNRSPDKF